MDDYCLKNLRADLAPPCNNAIFSSLRVDEYKHSPQLLEHTPHHNTIIVSRNASPLWTQLEIGGERRDESIAAGDVIINPGGVKQSAVWDRGNTHVVIITLDTNFFEHAAYEYKNPDCTDLLPCFPQTDPLICAIAQVITAQIQRQNLVNLEYIDQMAVALIVHLLENYCSTVSKLPGNPHESSNTQLRRIYQYIEDNLDRNILLQELANLLGVSLYHFIRSFKKSTGKTPAQYITNQRLKKAIHLLNSTNLEISTIAQQAGFYDHSHLCRAFRSYLSATPNQYRKN
jgi:AraC family transcriptional regulator